MTPCDDEDLGRYADQAAVRAAQSDGVGLCTLVGIEGSFSRRLGAQLAILPDGAVIGSMADGCLEAALATDMAAARAEGRAQFLRYGRNPARIDFRLPCGSALALHLDPAPDRAAIAAAVAALDARETASLTLRVDRSADPDRTLSDMALPDMDLSDIGADGRFVRRYRPAPRLVVAGSGPEAECLVRLASGYGIAIFRLAPIGDAAHARGDAIGIALGAAPHGVAIDPWTAIVLLFHDHEWEAGLLHWAMATDAFYIGAQGGAPARDARLRAMRAMGFDPARIARLRSPIGLIGHARDPQLLALSVLAEVVASYENDAP